jgi:hypothetical protein
MVQRCFAVGKLLQVTPSGRHIPVPLSRRNSPDII